MDNGCEMVVEPKRHLFTLEEYVQLWDACVLPPDVRTELIEGEIFEMPPPGPDHSHAVYVLHRRLIEALGDRAYVRGQDTVWLPPTSAPEPDVSVASGHHSLYRERQPDGKDLALVIEVAKTTHRFDRLRKIPLYALQGVREAWLVDADAEQIEIYRDPTDEGYRSVNVVRRGETISPEAFPDVRIAVDEVFE